jgi:hypothetical protein
LKKALWLSRWSRRFNRGEILKALIEIFSRGYHFRFRVPLQVDCCYSSAMEAFVRTKAFAGAK